MIDREMDARIVVDALHGAEINLDKLDGVPEALAMLNVTIPPFPESGVDDLVADVTAGKVKPSAIARRVYDVAHAQVEQSRYANVRRAVVDRIAARVQVALKNNLDDIHAQLDERFTSAADRLREAVGTLGDTTDAGAALKTGTEDAWRTMQAATAELETLANAVTKLPDLGSGSNGKAVSWFVPVGHLDEVRHLPPERPTDPCGRFVGWLRAGHELVLATGQQKIERDEYVRQLRQAENDLVAKKPPKASPTVIAENQRFQRGAPVINQS